MGIPLALGFDIGSAVALDNRTNVADITARDALNTTTLIKGIVCYCQTEDAYFKWDGSAWVDFEVGGGGSGGGPFVDNTDVGTILIDPTLGESVRVLGDGAAPVIVEGIDTASVEDGQTVRIHNLSGYPLTLKNSAATDPDDSMYFSVGGDLIVPDGLFVEMVYDANPSFYGWYCANTSPSSVQRMNSVTFGRGDSNDVTLYADNGTAVGVLRYNFTSLKWTFSNDGGTNFSDLGGGPKVTTVLGVHSVDINIADVILCDMTIGAYTVTLPDPSLTQNKIIRVKKTTNDANRLTVVSSTGNIDNAAAWETEDENAGISVVSDGVNWRSI